MKIGTIAVLLLVLAGYSSICPLAVTGAEEEVDEIREAIHVLDEIVKIPEQSIPPTLLSRAKAIAIIPNVLKVGLLVGGRHGNGILLFKHEDGSWSNPYLVSFSGGGIGFQVGAQSTDFVLVFKSLRNIETLKGRQVTFGADMAFAAGPVGRQAEVGTDLSMRSEIYSFSRSRGLFAGFSLEGSSLEVDYEATSALYNREITSETSAAGSAPQAVKELHQVLNRAENMQIPSRKNTDKKKT